MASISKRTGKSWKVLVGPQQARLIDGLGAGCAVSPALHAMPPRFGQTFTQQSEAEAVAAVYREQGVQDVTVKVRSTTAWQARVRLIGAPSLTRTFANKAMAEQWVREREGEIAERSFVDYREAEHNTLGDLLRRYDVDKRGQRPAADPDRVRLRLLAAHPMATIRVSLLARRTCAPIETAVSTAHRALDR
jgi:hypothetical protein